MALSFKEKRAIQKTVRAKIGELKSGDLSFKEKRAAQKELRAALAKLKVKVDAGHDSEKLRKLVAGDYDSLSPVAFLAVLKEIVDEIDDIEPVKPPTIRYVQAKIDAGQAVLESAFADVPGGDDGADSDDEDRKAA